LPRSLPRKQHGQKEQPAAHEDRGKQPIVDRAELLAHNTNEPWEGDPGERHQKPAVRCGATLVIAAPPEQHDDENQPIMKWTCI
jgi:hypothetical protein